MSGVWIFEKNGIIRLVKDTAPEFLNHREPSVAPGAGERPNSSSSNGRVLMYLPENQVISSYDQLERKLTELGWTRYRNPNRAAAAAALLQFHRSDTSSHLISLPKSFDSLKQYHMYDVVVKTRGLFKVCHLQNHSTSEN